MSQLDSTPEKKAEKEVQHEAQFTGSGWKNPYVLYILLTTALFLFLILMGAIALDQGWVPSRSSGS